MLNKHYLSTKMRIILSSIFIVFSIFGSLAQEDVWCYINARSGEKYKTPNEVLQAVDNTSGNLSFIFKHRKLTKYFLFNNNKEIISEFVAQNLTKKATLPVAGFCAQNKHVVFLKNFNNSIFDRVEIDYDTQTVGIQTIGLDLKKEYLIETFQEGSTLYLLSIKKNTSVLKLHEIALDGSVNEKLIDLSSERFEKFNGLETTLHYLITSKEHPSKKASSRINFNIPNSIETTSAINKIYCKDGVITVTNDNVSSKTNIIQIDIKNGNYKYFQVPKQGFTKEELRSESNSFILDNLYFSFYVTLDKLVFAVYDLEKETIIKVFEVKDEEEISFKNTPVIIADGKIERNKNRKNSNSFLRQLTNSNVGISAYKKDDLIIITLGGALKENGAAIAIIGGVVGGLAAVLILESFEAYISSKSTRVDCLFDYNFNHIDGDIPINGFDKLKAFIKSQNLINAPLQSMFEYRDNYIWGSFNKKRGLYELYKFEK